MTTMSDTMRPCGRRGRSSTRRVQPVGCCCLERSCPRRKCRCGTTSAVSGEWSAKSITDCPSPLTGRIRIQQLGLNNLWIVRGQKTRNPSARNTHPLENERFSRQVSPARRARDWQTSRLIKLSTGYTTLSIARITCSTGQLYTACASFIRKQRRPLLLLSLIKRI